MEPRISCITLGVANVSRAREFYEKLGWRANAQSSVHIAFFQVGGLVVALWSREALAEDAELTPGTGYGGITLSYNVRKKEDVAAVLAEAERAGGRILTSAEDTFWGGHAGHFADPDRHVWEVAWNPGWAIRPDGSVELPK